MKNTKHMLYLFNSTSRNPIRLIEIQKQLHKLELQKLNPEQCLNSAMDIVNKDIKLRDNTLAGRKVSFKRKKSEVNKLPFINIDASGKLYNLCSIEGLNPPQNLVSEHIDKDCEWNSNIMLLTLAKGNHLADMYSLINTVDLKWAKQGKRKGIAELELIYLFAYLTYNEKVKIEDLSDLVINLRTQFKNIGSGHEKDFLIAKIKTDFSEKMLKNGRDYIDTLMRSFALTQCFQITRHGVNQSNIFAMRLLSINTNFNEKSLFFINNSYELIGQYIQKNTLCDNLYKSFDVLKAYSQQSEEINATIQQNPQQLALADNWETGVTPSWYQYEYNCSIHFMQMIQKNEKAYNHYTKHVAIKTYLNAAYAATASGVADSSIIFDNVVMTVESSTLMPAYQQCSKEYVPNKTHLLKLAKDNNKKYGLCITVMPKISIDFNKDCIAHNYSNNIALNEEKTIMIALSTVQYVNFLKHINTEKKVLDFIDYMLSVDYSKHMSQNEIFYELFCDYSNLNKSSMKIVNTQVTSVKVNSVSINDCAYVSNRDNDKDSIIDNSALNYNLSSLYGKIPVNMLLSNYC